MLLLFLFSLNCATRTHYYLCVPNGVTRTYYYLCLSQLCGTHMLLLFVVFLITVWQAHAITFFCLFRNRVTRTCYYFFCFLSTVWHAHTITFVNCVARPHYYLCPTVWHAHTITCFTRCVTRTHDYSVVVFVTITWRPTHTTFVFTKTAWHAHATICVFQLRDTYTLLCFRFSNCVPRVHRFVSKLCDTHALCVSKLRDTYTILLLVCSNCVTRIHYYVFYFCFFSNCMTRIRLCFRTARHVYTIIMCCFKLRDT